MDVYGSLVPRPLFIATILRFLIVCMYVYCTVHVGIHVLQSLDCHLWSVCTYMHMCYTCASNWYMYIYL